MGKFAVSVGGLEGGGAGATAVNQKASGGMGLIRDPGDEIKEGSSNRLNCICHNCREQFIQSRPQRNWGIKAEEGGGAAAT